MKHPHAEAASTNGGAIAFLVTVGLGILYVGLQEPQGMIALLLITALGTVLGLALSKH